MKKLFSTILILTVASIVYGQGEFSLYNLNRSVPQAHQLNPAFRPDAKVIIGLPIISSTHVSVDMDQLSFNRIFTETFEGSLTLDTDNFSSILKEKNNFSVQSDLQLFFLGISLGNSFLSVAFNDRVSSLLVYSKDIADLALFGNGDERTFGRNLSLDHMLFRQNLYHELAIGFSTGIGDKFSFGGRLKILSGVVNAQTEQISGFLRTDADSIHLANSSFKLRNSGFNYFEEELDILSMYRNTLPFVGGNGGLGFDFGAEYLINHKMSVSASVTDIGFINWRENTESIQFDEVNYSFKGFDVIDILNKDTRNDNFLQHELDSLESLFTPTELENIVYNSSLVSNFYTGFNYQIAKSHHVGAQIYGRMADGNITPEFGAYYNLQLGRILNATVNASFRNGQLHAAGVGASLDLGPIQIYGTTESVTSLINPQAASLLDGRVGLNLKFGRKKVKKEEEQTVEEPIEEEPVEEEIPDEEIDNSPEEEEPAVEEIQQPPVEEPIPVVVPAIIPVAVTTVTPPPVENTIKEEEKPVVIQENFRPAPMEFEELKEVVVHQGDHEDELELGHYIVVGAFLSRDNAQKYSNSLKAKGYENEFGFLTEKDFYYVTVYKNTGDIEMARKVRNEYRRKNDFLFPDTWLLSVVK